MGNCFYKARNVRLLREARGKLSLNRITTITDLKVDRSRVHSLPIPHLPSRLASATIWSFQGVKRDVIVLLILMSRSSRAYIITQEGLPGFLPTEYASFHDLLVLKLKVPPHIAKDYKDFKTFKDGYFELISRHPEWYNSYHKLKTDQMAEPRPVIMIPTLSIPNMVD